MDAAGGLKVPFESGIAAPGGVGGCEEVGAACIGGGDVMGWKRVEPCAGGRGRREHWRLRRPRRLKCPRERVEVATA